MRKIDLKIVIKLEFRPTNNRLPCVALDFPPCIPPGLSWAVYLLSALILKRATPLYIGNPEELSPCRRSRILVQWAQIRSREYVGFRILGLGLEVDLS